MCSLWGSPTLITHGLTEIAKAVSAIENEEQSRALHICGTNLRPYHLSNQTKSKILYKMMTRLFAGKSFDAFCYTCSNFVMFVKDTVKCPFQSDECPVHQVYTCSKCFFKWDLTMAQEDLDILIDYNKKLLLSNQ